MAFSIVITQQWERPNARDYSAMSGFDWRHNRECRHVQFLLYVAYGAEGIIKSFTQNDPTCGEAQRKQESQPYVHQSHWTNGLVRHGGIIDYMNTVCQSGLGNIILLRMLQQRL